MYVCKNKCNSQNGTSYKDKTNEPHNKIMEEFEKNIGV